MDKYSKKVIALALTPVKKVYASKFLAPLFFMAESSIWCQNVGK